MATNEWIESADRKESQPIGSFAESRADHFLHGATAPAEAIEVERAARLAWRQAPDIADAFGLPAPKRPTVPSQRIGSDVLDELQCALWERGEDAARAVAADLLAVEVDAARRELDRRRGKR